MKRQAWLAAAALAACVAGSIVPGGAIAQTKLKFAHVYEISEPYHTAAVWAAGEIAKRTATATPWRYSRPRRSARKPTSTRG